MALFGVARFGRGFVGSLIARWLVVGVFLFGAGGAGANVFNSVTPSTDFTDNGDGTVLHKTTGLTWKRCSEGQARRRDTLGRRLWR